MADKYTDIYVHTEINCSSLTQYHVDVSWIERDSTGKGVGVKRAFYIDDWQFMSTGDRNDQHEWNGAPAYLLHEVGKQLRTLVLDKTPKVFEYDQEGEKRYTDLRYHDEAYLRRLVSRWAEE